MNIKETYETFLESKAKSFSWANDWRWMSICCLCIYAAVLALRVSFAGRWDNELLWVGGERLLSTHDAYFWLAKAKGLGSLVGYPLAEAAKIISEWTGASLGTVGFWAPAFLGALVAVVCALWGWLLAGREAAIFAGLAGALTPGFFYRSRLGYFDTDLFTLLGPLVVAWMLAYWSELHTKRGWFLGSRTNDEREFSPLKSMSMALVFGLVTRFVCLWHYDIQNMSVCYFLLTLMVVVVNSVPERRAWGLWSLAIYLIAAFPGTVYGGPGYWFVKELLHLDSYWALFYIAMAVVVMAGCWFADSRNVALVSNLWVACAGLFVFILLTGVVNSPVIATLDKLGDYFNHIAVSSSGGGAVEGPAFPSILQSVIEAKLIPLSEILERGAFNSFVGGVALLLALPIVVLRPAAIFLLPLIVLQLLGIKMGVRFSMFGGAAMMVCLGVGVYWASELVLKKFAWKQWGHIGIQVALGIIVLLYCHAQYSKQPLTPVITKSHAEALQILEKISPADSRVWTWWDWGYATQYYAGRVTTIDGGEHSGQDVFPTALVMSTHSPQQASQLIGAYSTFKTKNLWKGQSGAQMMGAIDQMKNSEKTYAFRAPQYIVVTWKDLTISKWITFYGNWNLATGDTKQARLSNFAPGQLGFNIKKGAVLNRDGGGGLVSDITILSEQGVDKKEYYLNKLSPQLLPRTRHLLINEVSRQSVLMDRTAYRSLLTRLLTGDADDPEISKYFKLVVDKLPFVRIYEVVQ
ncbi:STT3 domain-containing protein [Pseudodesulfovibrio sp. zrk46]|uniref:STT3 domain-containing protein n=1 Tax=Pseudodesulfovibrio sp. zrk46 TaxID=2725288 RepID=UPI001449583B|nr:STT3 domain-containing protein [Pseudodesulfovibrio sp. zrk46]QJB56602.1 oligosaccharyl transferase STT3 subunit [Pseudodesulfovibrio sp. zrk46]